MNERIEILGVPFSNKTMDETVDLLSNQIQHGSELFHLITVNPEITMTAQSDNDFKKIIDEAQMITPDGIGIVLAAKIQNKPIKERVTGYDLLLRLLEKGNHHKWSFYFLGTDEQTNQMAVEQIVKRYKNVKIAGRHHGFFTKDEEPLIINDIKHTNPDVLILAMGAPYSDKWLWNHKGTLSNVKVAFGVGGSLDVIAGKVKETPQIWKTMNLEWLHRLLTVPVAKGQKSRWRRQILFRSFYLKY